MLSARNTMMVGGGFTRGAPVNPQGIFEFRSVAPGSYFVVAPGQSRRERVSPRGPRSRWAASNIEGISLTIGGGVPVTGQVRVEGETTESLAKVQVMLQPAEAGAIMFGPLPTQQLKQDGSFQLEDVGADRYNAHGQRPARGLLCHPHTLRQPGRAGRRSGCRRRIAGAAGCRAESQGRRRFPVR